MALWAKWQTTRDDKQLVLTVTWYANATGTVVVTTDTKRYDLTDRAFTAGGAVGAAALIVRAIRDRAVEVDLGTAVFQSLDAEMAAQFGAAENTVFQVVA